jgi:GDP-4-dehydro-6-deoxy-D-mannose reductase
MRVFVTGAKGFVGGHLLPRLNDAGMQVTATDREVDVTDAASIAGALRRARPDAIIHLAAQSSVAASWKDPLEAFRINYLGSLTLLAALRAEAPRARLLLIGSADAYGGASRTEQPIRETDPLLPNSPYARSKAAAEQLGALAAAKGLDVVRVRAFTHIGDGQSDRFVASSFARQVARIAAGTRVPKLTVGNLDSVRDFLDVRDVVDAYALLLDPAVPADVYNVASGRGVPIREVLDHLLELAGLAGKVEVEVDPDRYRETDYLIGDATRLRAATDWAPAIPLRETLTGLLEWWRDHAEQHPG